MAVLLGDAYEREPEAVVAWLADVRHQAQEQSAAEAREWTQGVESDPELAGEIAAATTSYQQETGYSAYQPTVVRQTYVQVRPYSYWVGYPWWYDASYVHYAPWYYWYPRVHWSFGGFYFGPRLMVSFGVPHGGFWGWYFHRPIHHHHYPRVTHYAVQYYDRHYAHHYHHGYRHRRHHVRHHQTVAHAVHHFRRDAERSMPHGFLRDDRNRVDRFREYGHLRGDGERERNRNDAGKALRPTEMLKRVKADGGRYPHLRQLARQPVERPKHQRGERRPLELKEKKARATGGTLDRRVSPQREAKAKPRGDRPKPRRADWSKPSVRKGATRVARAEPAMQSRSPQLRAEPKRRPVSRQRAEPKQRSASRQQAALKQRPAPRQRVVPKQRPAPRQRAVPKQRPAPQQPRQHTRPAPRTSEPRHARAERTQRVQKERAQPKARQTKREHRKAGKTGNARSRRSR